MVLRHIENSDLDRLKDIDYTLWLRIKWNKAIIGDEIFVAVDSALGVVGAAVLVRDGTFYYLPNTKAEGGAGMLNQSAKAGHQEGHVPEIPLYCVQLEISAAKGAPAGTRRLLIEFMKERFRRYQLAYSDKKLCMRVFHSCGACGCDGEGAGTEGRSSDIGRLKLQELLEAGFSAYGVMFVLVFDLAGNVPEAAVPEGVGIVIQGRDSESMRAYLKSNAEGYGGVQDSADDLYFRLQSGGSEIFAAKRGGEVLSSCTIWKISEGNWATENVFTIPDHRRRGLARATLLTALRYLKERGNRAATLTVTGDNTAAMKMYMSMGYRLGHHMLELHYCPQEERLRGSEPGG